MLLTTGGLDKKYMEAMEAYIDGGITLEKMKLWLMERSI